MWNRVMMMCGSEEQRSNMNSIEFKGSRYEKVHW